MNNTIALAGGHAIKVGDTVEWTEYVDWPHRHDWVRRGVVRLVLEYTFGTVLHVENEHGQFATPRATDVRVVEQVAA